MAATSDRSGRACGSGLPSRSCVPLTVGFHGSAGDEDRGHVQAHGPEQHTRVILSHWRCTRAVCAVCVDHVLDAVGDELALGKEYNIPPWPIAIPSSTAMVLNSTPQPPRRRSPFDALSDVVQVHVTGDELRETFEIAMIGFSKSHLHAGARQSARAPAILRPEGGATAIACLPSQPSPAKGANGAGAGRPA